METLEKRNTFRRPVVDAGLPAGRQEMDFGKLPPQARELEEAVLGAVMLENNAIYLVIGILKSEEFFYVDAHQRIWKAVKALYFENRNIDLLTVVEQLKKHGDLSAAGGPYAVTMLTNKVASAANIVEHAHIILEKYVLRRIIGIATDANRNAYDDTNDVFDLLNYAAGELDNINMELAGQSNQSFPDVVYETAYNLKKAAQSGSHITGVPSFSHRLDRHLLGFQPTDLVILAARPAMGKTSIALHMAANQAKHGIPVGFISLEMSKQQLLGKMFAAATGFEQRQIAEGRLTDAQWQRFDLTAHEIAAYPFYLNDTGGLSINQIAALAKTWVRKHGVKIIYIDYIGLISGGDTDRRYMNREQELSQISSRLKSMAKALQIPLIVLSQLSRACELRQDKRPLLSDLRDSGALEQDADVIIFPFRPEYYGITADPATGNALPGGLTELNIGKFRNGKTGTVYWEFDKSRSSFKDSEFEG